MLQLVIAEPPVDAVRLQLYVMLELLVAATVSVGASGVDAAT
jgi:hypothetical protein